MSQAGFTKRVQLVLVSVAIFFGALTLFAGSRVLLGTDPGYKVFLPLLIYNTTMGLAYVASGIVAWGSPKKGRRAAAMIFVLNLMVLGAIYYLYSMENSVAIESLHAMILRTGVWLGLFIGFSWLSRGHGASTGH